MAIVVMKGGCSCGKLMVMGKPNDEVESVDCFSINTIKAMMSSGEIITSITLAILGRFILGQDYQPVNSSSI